MKHKRNSTKKRIVKQYLNGTSVNSLAQDNSIPVSTIYSWIKHYGPLRAKYVPRHSEKQYAILKAEYDKLRYMYGIRKEFDNYHKDNRRRRLEFIYMNKEKYGVHALCEALEITRASFYRYERYISIPTWYEDRRRRVVDYVIEIFNESNGIYGANRIAEIVKKKYNEPVSKGYIRNIMSDLGYYSKHSIHKRETELRAYMRNTNNLIKTFEVMKPNELWLTDCKKEYIYAEKKYVTICTIEDLFSRRIIAHSYGRTESARLVLKTLRMAIELRKPEPGLVLHSDRGSAYRSKVFNDYLLRHGIEHSFSKPHHPKENAPMESFNALLQFEAIAHNDFSSVRAFKQKISDYIYRYNNELQHSRLRFMTPVEYEERYYAGVKSHSKHRDRY